MRTIVPALLLLASSTAFAQDRRNCSEDYSPQDFRGAISQAEERLANVDMNGAVSLLTEAGKRVLCMDVAVGKRDIARFAQNLSLLAFYGQDEFAAVKYGNLARLADPDVGLPDGVSETHPYAMLMEEEELPPIGGPVDPTLVYPRGGAFYMNGNRVTEARASAEVPQMVQVFNEHDEVIDAYWQDGAAFEPRYLPGGAGGAGSGPNIALVGAGAAAVGVGAVLYVVAAASAGGMKKAESPDELTKIRTTTNMLVLTSGVAAAAGVGIGASAFLLEGGSGVQFNVRF